MPIDVVEKPAIPHHYPRGYTQNGDQSCLFVRNNMHSIAFRHWLKKQSLLRERVAFDLQNRLDRVGCTRRSSRQCPPLSVVKVTVSPIFQRSLQDCFKSGFYLGIFLCGDCAREFFAFDGEKLFLEGVQ